MPVLQAPAKLNLTLDIVGRRPDGYHLLDTIFHTIDVCDVLDMQPLEDGIKAACDPPLTGENNIVIKAAQRFYQMAGIAPGCRIHITKHIPLESGLGGGSADAAAALRLLNDYYAHPLNDEQLELIGVALGADVPFALRQGHCRGQGIGELLQPLPLKRPLDFVLLKPEQGLSTAEMFRQTDGKSLPDRPDTQAAADALAQGDLARFAQAAYNVLQPAAQEQCPQIATLCDALYEQNAVYAAMTGSGSTVFGLFDGTQAAEQAAQALDGIVPFVRVAHTWQKEIV